MATTKRRKSPLKGRKHTHTGVVRKHKRKVNGVNPPAVSGMRKKRRKAKVSGVTGNDFMDLLLGTATGVVLGIVYDKAAPIENAKIRKGLEVALGLGTAYFGSTKKNNFVMGIGGGLLADGLKGTAKELGIISGMENIMAGMGLMPKDDMMVIEMNGIDQQSVMSGESRGGAQNIIGSAMPPAVS